MAKASLFKTIGQSREDKSVGPEVARRETWRT